MKTSRITVLILGIGAFLIACVPNFQSSTQATEDSDGWVSLFNGKDLTGWKIHPNPSGKMKSKAQEKEGKVVAFVGVNPDGKEEMLWHVENGMLIGSGHASHLFSKRGDYTNFHYKVEAKINDHGNSGQYFRTQYGPGFPRGYEAQINATHGDKIRTGSLYLPNIKEVLVLNTAPHKADEFFTQEVIADGNHIQIIVNGKTTVDWKDPENRYKSGHFALQGHDPGTKVTFKSIMVKEIKK